MIKINLTLYRQAEEFLIEIQDRATTDLTNLRSELLLPQSERPPKLHAGMMSVVKAIRESDSGSSERLSLHAPLQKMFRMLSKDSLPDTVVFRSALASYQSQLEFALESGLFFKLSKDEADQYNSGSNALGLTVTGKFPDAAADIAEAAKCLSMGRYTAGVFHLMRVTEAGIQEVARLSGIAVKPNDRRNWGQTLTNIRKARDKNVAAGVWDTNKGDQVTHCHSLINSIKKFTRDPTIHLDSKLLSQQEAAIVYGTVRVFMNEVATMMDWPDSSSASCTEQ